MMSMKIYIKENYKTEDMQSIEQGNWEEKYRPIKNEWGSLKDFHPKIVGEKDGEKLLKAIKENRVWTLIDNGDSLPIVSGLHWINRLDVYITEVPFEGERGDIEVYF